MTLRIAAVAAALSFHTAALAAESAVAAELARLLVPKEAYAEGVGQVAKQVQGQLQMHPGAQLEYPADFQKTIRSEVEKVVPYEDTLALHARELQASFGEAEIKDLATFFRSPLGQKWLASSGTAQQKVAVELDRRLREKMPEIMTRLAKMGKPSTGTAMPQGHPATGAATKPATAPPAKAATEPSKK